VLIDTGLGRTIASQLKGTPLLFRLATDLVQTDRRPTSWTARDTITSGYAIWFSPIALGPRERRTELPRCSRAYLADVYIPSEHRGKGLSRRLIQEIVHHPDLKGLRRILLATRDAHGLYAKFGFKPLAAPDRIMEIHNPSVYRDGGKRCYSVPIASVRSWDRPDRQGAMSLEHARQLRCIGKHAAARDLIVSLQRRVQTTPNFSAKPLASTTSSARQRPQSTTTALHWRWLSTTSGDRRLRLNVFSPSLRKRRAITKCRVIEGRSHFVPRI